VHTAVMYGEDDYNLGVKMGLPRHHTVDRTGKFTKDVPGLEGKYVKSADKEIIEYLRERGLLFNDELYEHDYPFCWRCGQPLLYYAMDSWFIGMSKLEKALRKNNQKVNWYPAHLKEGRFGEWLKGVKDWTFSRERYWGTPLPIWQCMDHHEHRVVAGSFEDLEKMRFRKKNLYFLMRHGMSTKNEDDIISSHLANDHYPLTAKGRAMVEKEAKKLSKMGVDVIYTSPFLRTTETAEIIRKITGAKVIVDERLKEIDHGSMCEGATRTRCLPDSQVYPNNLDERLGDGESWNQVRERTMSLVREVDAKHEGKNIVIVGHGDPLAVLAGTVSGWADEDLLKVLKGDRFTSDREGEHWFYPKKGKFYVAELKNWPWDEKGQLNPHRPYVDAVVLKCPECSAQMKRVKEVIDVWFDSGAMPFAQWHYPFKNKTKFRQNFPADFITEGIDQTRGWFYTLLAVSTLLGKGPAYKNVVSYSHVLDEKGQKMSKSKGNAVSPWEVIEKTGVDAARWYFYSVNNPGDPKLFSINDVMLRMRSVVMTLWNSFRFFELYNLGNQDFPVNFHKTKPDNDLDRWLLSRLHGTIKAVTECLDSYDPTTASRAIERLLVEDFSQWWLRRSRNRFQRPENAEALKVSLSFFRFFLLELAKLLAPFMPFIAEHIHQELHRGSPAGERSVHWHDWPEVEANKIDWELEKEMALIQKISNAALAIRQQEKIKVRQPLSKLVIWSKEKIREDFLNLLKDELNVKEIVVSDKEEANSLVIQETDGLKVGLDTHVDRALQFEGWARELVRQIQDMRKEAKYHFSEKVFGFWSTGDKEVEEAIGQWADFVKQNSLLKEFNADASYAEKTFDIQKEFDLAPGKKVWLGIKK
ncbi:MAG: class I tRNA ligase family protein, partial [bacterium]|nr:class I tRNA ligase family protein [bacterium]